MQYVPTVYRQPIQADHPFIYNSWLKSFRTYSSWATQVAPTIFFANHKMVIAKLLEEAGVLVACNPDLPDQIFGYAVFTQTGSNVTVLHYVYVKHPFRKMGVAGGLVATVRSESNHDKALPMIATHIPDKALPMDEGVWDSMWNVLRLKWDLIYNPYIMGTETIYDKSQIA